ncbi:MAG: flagellar assembly protein FliH [Spirochaetaceae bacterium]|jgi:flagellar assembly protein FliH|nr:flagellar assembly protein FliH [Spirochaetaceae bacterium]
MAKYVFRAGELKTASGTVVLKAPYSFEAEEPSELEELDVSEIYSGPTADELRAEAEAFKQSWEVERESLRIAAKQEAEEIVRRAREEAEAAIARKEAECQALRENAEARAADTIADAERRAKELLEDSGQKYAAEKQAAEDSGREDGRKEGYAAGKAEADRLVARIHTMLERVQDRRQQILDEAEQQIVDLALFVARKVVKVLVATDHEEIVRANVSAALRKVRSRGIVTIKVNLADLDVTTEHKEEFTRLIETTATGAGEVDLHIHEDSSIDSGGCVVETDFGEIDARINAQLAEIESRILEVSPLKQSKQSGQSGQSSRRSSGL